MAKVPAVRGREIVSRFDDVIARYGIDLDATPRQIHGLVGPNDAGTTLVGLVLDLAVANEGPPEIPGTPARRALTGPTVAGRKKLTATSSCTSTGDTRNPYGSSTAWPTLLTPTSKG